jgi:adenine-specific DNA-methyltransferase
MKSLLEQLPSIVAEGKKEAERVMERAESNYRLGLQTRELVVPSRDTNWQDFLTNASRSININESASRNQLVYGDNLLAMAALLAGGDDFTSMRGGVDLIYIDPPFDSKADYRSKILISGDLIEQLPTALEQFAYSDTWADGTASYLGAIVPRLYLMKELLSDEGNIFVHLDWHVVHYVKIVMDTIFGRDNFKNDIVWKRKGGSANPSNQFGIVTDSILFYSKSDDSFFSPSYSLDNDEAQNYIKERFRNEFEGRKYMLAPIERNAALGIRPNLKYEYNGYTPAYGWMMSREKLQQFDRDNKLHWNSKGKPNRRVFLDEYKGQPTENLWTDIYVINPMARERVNYDTQKPESLLSRIIETSCKPGGRVADFYSGSGTTAAVAERLGYNWVVSDLGKPACMVTRKRLIDQDAKPFLYQHIGDYQVEQMRSTMGSRFRIGDLAEIVLGLYGALPLPVEENPNKNMGRLQGSKTLVLADSPNKMTGLATLRRAIEIRDNLMGGWDKVVILGWNFSPTIGHDIEALGQGDRLEVLVIPPDLLDRLKKKGHKLKADEVRFSSLQYLKLGAVTRNQDGNSEALSISIANYVLLSPEALNLDEANREKLQKIINTDPLALIEYWSVDPDYDGEVFRSVWQDYRGNTENDADAYRVVTTSRLTSLPKKDGPRRVCVRVVDVFGFEAEATIEVA